MIKKLIVVLMIMVSGCGVDMEQYDNYKTVTLQNAEGDTCEYITGWAGTIPLYGGPLFTHSGGCPNKRHKPVHDTVYIKK